MNKYEEEITKNFSVDAETAEAEFYRFAEAWQIDVFADTMSDEQEEEFLELKRKIITPLRRGSALVDESGDIIYTLQKPFKNSDGAITLEKFHLKRPAGRHWSAMDGIGNTKSIKKMMSFYAAVLGVTPATLNKLDGLDMRIIQSVYTLFLSS